MTQPGDNFRILYNRYAGPLFRFIFRFTNNKEAAEEILHDIFTELLAGRFNARPDANLKSWLYTVAKNRCLNHVKKSAFEVKNNEFIESQVSSFDLEAIISDQRFHEKFERAENDLPSDLKQTWLLRKQGMDYQQVATQLAIPLGTVKSRFFRLVEHLRKELGYEK